MPIVNAAAEFSATTVVNQVLTTGTGELDALDVNTGKLLWAAPLKAPDFGAAAPLKVASLRTCRKIPKEYQRG